MELSKHPKVSIPYGKREKKRYFHGSISNSISRNGENL